MRDGRNSPCRERRVSEQRSRKCGRKSCRIHAETGNMKPALRRCRIDRGRRSATARLSIRLDWNRFILSLGGSRRRNPRPHDQKRHADFKPMRHACAVHLGQDTALQIAFQGDRLQAVEVFGTGGGQGCQIVQRIGCPEFPVQSGRPNGLGGTRVCGAHPGQETSLHGGGGRDRKTAEGGRRNRRSGRKPPAGGGAGQQRQEESRQAG